MIKVTLTNEILSYITEIEQNRYKVSSVKLSKAVMNRLRKNSKKKSSYASNKIEGNPLSEKQVDEVIESDERKHYLKPEQEVRNYFLALNYLEERNTIEAVEGSTNALFLSLQKKRIGVRAVENLVKKYSKLITTMKNITPHKLRSTYGTSLYRETGDIYLVADVLGHKDVNTTKKHYAALEDERRRTAPKYIHLRDE